MTEAVHFHAPLAIHAHEDVVVLPLNAVFADHIALMILGQLRRVQFRFTHFTDVADHVRGHPILGIQPALSADDLKFGEGVGVFVRVDKRQLRRGQFFLDDDGLVFGRTLALKAMHPGNQRVIVEIQALGDWLEMLHLQRVPGNQDAERAVIVDNDPAVTVENLPSWSKHGNRLDAVLLGALLIYLRVANLQVPKTCDQKQKDRHHHVLKERDFASRELRVVAQQSRGRNLVLFALDLEVHFLKRLLSVYLKPDTAARTPQRSRTRT